MVSLREWQPPTAARFWLAVEQKEESNYLTKEKATSTWLLLLFIGEIMRVYSKLKQNWEFHRAYNRGVSLVLPECVMYVVKGKKNALRLGITAGKKIGTAVSRNRAKRVITAAFDICAPHIPSGYDCVVVARTRILNTKSNVVAANMMRQLKKQELWVE